MTNYTQPANPVTCELKVKRSVFIANLSTCLDVAGAKDFLAKIISQHKNATHNCRAYLLSNGDEYYSDDGEPSGTAGRPILNAIKHSQLVNVIVVVSRYFGGTKLGIKGLIDTYSSITAQALDLAGKTIAINTKHITLTLNYNSFREIKHSLESLGAINLSPHYGSYVLLNADIPVDNWSDFSHTLKALKAKGYIIDWEA